MSVDAVMTHLILKLDQWTTTGGSFSKNEFWNGCVSICECN